MIENAPLNVWVDLAYKCSASKGFHDKPMNVGEKIALMHAELSELLEAHRTNPLAPCEKDPALTCEQEEVADVFIRLADYCGARGLDLDRAVRLKYAYNLGRKHKHGRHF